MANKAPRGVVVFARDVAGPRALLFVLLLWFKADVPFPAVPLRATVLTAGFFALDALRFAGLAAAFMESNKLENEDDVVRRRLFLAFERARLNGSNIKPRIYKGYQANRQEFAVSLCYERDRQYFGIDIKTAIVRAMPVLPSAIA